MPPLITLTTDFGTADTYVAQMKGVIYARLPSARIVDITHQIEAQDVLGGAWALLETVRYFPVGTIHVAVVDPGVGTQRRILCAELAGHFFVLPDNGLLSLVLDRFAATRVHEVVNQTLWQSECSRTFHGRDIMAPVAAHLAQGTPITQVGPTIENVASIARFELPKPEIGPGRVRGVVVAVDRFGNAISNVTGDLVPSLIFGKNVAIEIDDRSWSATAVSTYADCPLGACAVLMGSQGYLEIAVAGGSAARELGLRKRSEFIIKF